MSDYPSLGSALQGTNAYLNTLSKEPTKIATKEATQVLHKTNTYLQTLRGQAIPEFNEKTINKILDNIDSLKEKKGKREEKFLSVLSKLESNLQQLKVKKHLDITIKNLVTVKKEVETKATQVNYRMLTTILQETKQALTVPKPELNPGAQKIIGQILKEIAFIQNRLDMQILTGTFISLTKTYQSQVHSFRNVLDELRARLLVLKKLKRGEKPEILEHEAGKQ